jgi:hypothetical protein
VNCVLVPLLLALATTDPGPDFVVPWRQEVEWAEAQASALLARSNDAAGLPAAREVATDTKRFVAAHPDHWMAKRLMTATGAALARNGDLASALLFWRKAHLLADPHGGYGLDSSVLDDHLPSLLELRHRWREALAVRLRWQPKSSCGNCEWALTHERAAAIWRCPIRLGRTHEARRWIREAQAPDPFTVPTARNPKRSIWRWHHHW